MIENNNLYMSIELNRKKEITFASSDIMSLVNENGFKDVESFVKFYKKDFSGYVE